MPTTLEKASIAANNWARYEYVRSRGHDDYCALAQRLEGMYLGGGEQWSEADKAVLMAQHRVPSEFNEIMPGVNAAIGYQIQNRLDIAFKPRGGMADQTLADIRTKVVKQISDQNRLHWKETQVFSDGLIEQRGYYDLRMDFSENIFGDLKIDTLDPLDVIPDPDTKDYHPDKWADVTVTRWLTLDEVEGIYGHDKRVELASMKPRDTDFGDDDGGVERNRISGDQGAGSTEYDAWRIDKGGTVRVRVIDRQRFVRKVTKVAVYPDGAIQIAEEASVEQNAAFLASNCYFMKRAMRRVHWTVTTKDVILFDGLSPYPFYTIVPYFPYFRRGKTRGMVDNAVGPQEALNKLGSQYIHIINSTANSGWITEENSLTNMSVDELEDVGAQTGLVMEVAQGAKWPTKIQPNQVPAGVDRMIERLTLAVRDATTPEAMRGLSNQDATGIAIQSRQFAAQQQLAVPLDNLALTRHILASRFDWFIGHYYDTQRVFRITGVDPMTGRETMDDLQINVLDPATGEYINDMTVGTYDVVISEQPMQVTFENGQFEQAVKIREIGVSLPDRYVVKYSNLADKQEIMQAIDAAPAKADPEAEAKAELLAAQADKTRAEAVSKRVETLYSATQAAQNIAMTPAVAPMSDAIARSAGYEDQDAAPIMPPVPAGMEVAPPVNNTNPLTPANPGVGVTEGIESPVI